MRAACAADGVAPDLVRSTVCTCDWGVLAVCADPEGLTPPAAASQPEPTGPTTSIGFATSSHDFGKIMQDSDNHYAFKFTNTGKEPLLISDAKGSCGCTVPEYPKEPIAPGKVGEIKVVYKPGGQQGSQSKTVTVTANTNPPQTLLNISADVQVDPSAAPMAVPTH